MWALVTKQRGREASIAPFCRLVGAHLGLMRIYWTVSEGSFSETQLLVLGLLGNWASGFSAFSETPGQKEGRGIATASLALILSLKGVMWQTNMQVSVPRGTKCSRVQ